MNEINLLVCMKFKDFNSLSSRKIIFWLLILQNVIHQVGYIIVVVVWLFIVVVVCILKRVE